MASTGQNDDQVNVSDGGGLDGKKQVDDNSESSNLSFFEIRNRKLQRLAVFKAKWKEADDLKMSMLASGELPTPNQTMSKIALPTTVTGKRKAPESCDMSKSAKLPKGRDVLHGKMAAFFREKEPATELHASYEKIMGKTLREIKHAVGLRRTTGTGKRKAPESCDMLKKKEKELENSFLKEKWPATEDHASEGGGLDGRKLVCDNSESSNQSSTNLTVARETHSLISECHREQNDDRVNDSDGGGLDGKKQVDDNSESSNLSFYEIRNQKLQRLAMLKAKWKESDNQKMSMLASEMSNSAKQTEEKKEEVPKKKAAPFMGKTPAQIMNSVALRTTGTEKRKAPESCDRLFLDGG